MFTLKGRTRIAADGGTRDAEITWRSVGERGGVDGDPLEGDFHLGVEARIAVGLRRRIPLTPTGPEIAAGLDDDLAALVLLGSLFESGFTLEGDPPDVPRFPVPPGSVA